MKRRVQSIIFGLVMVLASISWPGYTEAAAADLPRSYSSLAEGYLTPVRDQGRWGTCWSFAITAAEEASLMRQGLADSSVDLSELALAYFMFHNETDPLGYTVGDGVQAVHSSWLDEGGFIDWGVWMLAMGQGIAYEQDTPDYTHANDNTTVDASLAYEATPYVLKNAYRVDIEDEEKVKEMIMQYGGVILSYTMDKTCFDKSLENYNYTGTGEGYGHASLIVGWDDAYPASKFADLPSRNGAWLIRNSWGEDSHTDGYFWMSYDSVMPQIYEDWYRPCVALEMGLRDYDNLYQYDGACGESGSDYDIEQSANIFYAYAGEEIRKVGFAFAEPRISYTVDIYTNVKDNTNPLSGTKAASVSGVTERPGYYTIDIDPVAVSADSAYAIVVTADRGGMPVSVQYDLTSFFPCMDVTSSMMPGQSYYKRIWDDAWEPMSEGNYRIKSYTVNVSGNAAEKAQEMQNRANDGDMKFIYDVASKTYRVIGYTGSDTEIVIDGDGDLPISGINGGAFLDNSRITKVTIRNIDIIDDKAFANAAVKEADIRNVKSINTMAFDGSALEKLYLENISEILEYRAFGNTPNLTDVQLVGSFGEIRTSAFGGCGVRKMEFPKAKSIESPFTWYDKVEEIVLTGDVEYLDMSIFETLDYGEDYNPNTGMIINQTLPLKKFVIKGEIGEIGSSLFALNSYAHDSETLGKLLEGVEIIDEKYPDGFVYNADKTKLLFVLPTVAAESVTVDANYYKTKEYAFTRVAGVKEIVLDSSDSSLVTEFFLADMEGLETIRINAPVKLKITGYMPNLKDIYVNSEDVTIDNQTLAVSSLSANRYITFGDHPCEVTVHAPAGSMAEKYAETYWYSFEDTLSGELTKRSSVNTDGRITNEDGTVLLADKHNGGKVVIPEGVRVIAPAVYALYDDAGSCAALVKSTEYVLPQSLEVLGDFAFYGNMNLLDFQIPSGIRVIGNCALGRIRHIESLSLSSSIEALGSSIFSLTDVGTLIFADGFHGALDKDTFDSISVRDVVIDGEVILDAKSNDGYFSRCMDMPETLTVNGIVKDLVCYGPFVGNSYTEVYFANRDMLYYNALYYGANIMSPESEIASLGISEERIDKLYYYTNRYCEVLGEYEGNPFTYDNIADMTDEDLERIGQDDFESGYENDLPYEYGADPDDDYDSSPVVDPVAVLIVIVLPAVTLGLVIFFIVRAVKKKKKNKSEAQ